MKYGPAVDEAIWALMCEGLKPAAIGHRLRENTAGLPAAIDMHERTLRYKIKKLRDRRGEPARSVAPGNELEAAEAVRRELLAMLAEETARLRGIGKTRLLTAAELNAADKAAATVARIEKELRQQAAAGSVVLDPENPFGSGDFLADLEKELAADSGTKRDDP
jgi:hypothetical protein